MEFSSYRNENHKSDLDFKYYLNKFNDFGLLMKN